MAINYKKILLLLFLLCGYSENSYAKEQVLTLHQALTQALHGNPEIRGQDRGLLAVHEDINIARSYLLPKVALEERFMRTSNPTYAFMSKLNQERFTMADFSVNSLNSPAPVSDFQTSISFEQPLFAPKAYIGIKMAKKEFEAQTVDAARKKEEVIFGVFKAYLDAQTAAVYVTVTEKGIEDAKEHLRIAESRYKNGLGLYSDKLRAEAALKNAEVKKVTAEKNLLVARRAIGLMLGLTESIGVIENRPSLQLRDIEHYRQMSSARKDLIAMEERSRNAENNLKMANASYLPVIGVGGAYQINSHKTAFAEEGESWQVMAFLRWDLFDGMNRESARRKAKHRLAEAGEYLDGLKKKAAYEVYEAYLSVGEAKKGHELAMAGLTSAEEGRRLVKTRFENSLSTVVDMLDAQTSLDAARTDVVAKEAAYYIALARLSFQSGTIMQDLEIEKAGETK